MSNQFLKISFFSLFSLFFSFSAQAVNPLDVVINEIAWMGTEVVGVESKNWWRYEWLELYNNTTSPISLDGWEIELYRTDPDWILELRRTIPAQGYFLIVASDKIFSNYDLNYSNLGGKFINSGQKVLLKDGDGQIVDEINCSSGWFAGSNLTKQTMERKNSLLASDVNNWQASQNPGGTPKAKNSVTTQISSQPSEEPIVEPEPQSESQSEPELIEEPQQELVEVKPQQITYPVGVVINEILPSPAGPDEEEEWIEIFNQNNFGVNLSGWQIADTAGETKTYAFSEKTIIGPQGFLVLFRLTTKITLNNSGDRLLLTQPNGNILDALTYEKAPRGQSYNLTESGWVWSSTLTPGSANTVPSPTLETAEESVSPKELAAIGEQIPSEKSSFLSPLIALIIAIFSGVIILIIKKKIKSGYN